MEAATVPQTDQQPEKFLVRNNTAGYIGVIEIDHRGEELGVNIEPLGARWMTEREMVATARAPRDPADNPFVEQTYERKDPETQRTEQFKMAPLTLEHDSDRFVPSNDRYVPTVDAPQGSGPPTQHEKAATPTAGAAPPSSGSQATPEAPAPEAPVATQGAPVPPQRTTPGASAAQAPSQGLGGSQTPAGGEEQTESWVAEPESPGEVISGSLNGDDGPAPEESATDAPDPTDAPAERFTPTAGQAQAAPQTPGSMPEEEHAAAVDPKVGEETGAAQPPTRRQPEGEFASAEEVGSPDAPAQDGNDKTEVEE